MATMNSEPDLSTAINSLVYIRARFLQRDGTSVYDNRSGVLIAPDIIFSTAHLN